MVEAEPTPDSGTSRRASVLTQGGIAVVVVAASTLLFWAIGVFGDEGGVPTVDPDPEVAAPDDDGTGDEAPEPPEDEVPEEEPSDEAPDDEGTDDETPDGDTSDDAADDDQDAGDEEDGDEGEQDAEAEAVDPADVSLQVLDGLKSDGGAAATAVADELTGLGYRVVARNQALDYAETTVLFNAGNEAAARRVAADLGGAAVREQPGNLSTQVDLHVVVGADRA